MEFDSRALSDCIDALTEPEPFSGVIHLTRGDEVLFQEARGLALRPESIPNTVRTRFQMASGCKIFTSVAVCQLVDEGKLDLGTRLRDCVDATFPHHAPDITIHHLLTHSSGITSYFEEDVDPDYEALWRDVPVHKMRRPRDFLPLFQDKPMKFAPGERFDYNDGGYVLLGLVVESVAGMDFASYVSENVFGLAGMDDSGYFATDRLPQRTARAYIRDADGGWRSNVFTVPIVGGPDGGAYTTASDMARFWRALVERRLLAAETTEAMLSSRIATASSRPYTDYGYGVWIEKAGGGVRKRFVEGSDPGVAMRSAVYPSVDAVLTVIGNTGDALWRLYPELEALLAL